MKAPSTIWTTEDLEVFHDGELDGLRHEEMTEDLRRDHRLRARLSRVRALDDLVARAMTSGADSAKPVRIRRRRPYLAAAAVVTLLGAVAYVVSMIMPRTTDAPARSYDPVRVVLSIPIEPTDQSASDLDASETAPTPSDRTDPFFEDEFELALVQGRVDEALRLVVGADPQQQAWSYRRISQLIASATAAEDLLDRMPPDRQLQICGQWVGSGHLRRVAFERLGMLAIDTTVAEDFDDLVRQLAADPEYHSWLKSYCGIEI
jgi:hypothetical protein